METSDLEVIIPSEDPTVATRPFAYFCDPYWCYFTSPFYTFGTIQYSTHELPAGFGTQYVSPVSDHSPGPPVLSPQLASDVNKDLTLKAKDKDQTLGAKDQDKD